MNNSVPNTNTVPPTVGQPFPAFSVNSVVSTEMGKEFQTYSNKDIQGKWSIFFFWPMNFTFVCPTEIVGFDALQKKFQNKDTLLLGGSTDTHYVHLAWRTHDPQLKDISFPVSR
jgi:peroxiredoxin (alkyl hydroperoxide reductase subunit C)